MSSVIGAPLAGAVLDMNGILGLRGWQWMFAVMGVPAVLVGISLLRLLSDQRETAPFLSADDRVWLLRTLAAEREQMRPPAHGNPFRRRTTPSRASTA